MKQTIRNFFISLMIAIIFSLEACSSSHTLVTNIDGQSNEINPKISGKITVFAASSLNKVAEQLATAFKKKYPQTQIAYNFAGSSELVRQISEAVSVDIFISADQNNMQQALKLSAFDNETPQVIATNKLVLATAAGNPGKINSIQDVSKHLIAVCAPVVPCGNIAHQALDYAQVKLGTYSEDSNVSEVTTQIATGTVEAGFIYSTDAKYLAKTQKNKIIELAGISPNPYLLALTTAGRQNAVAQAYAQFLKSKPAKEILTYYGFETR